MPRVSGLAALGFGPASKKSETGRQVALDGELRPAGLEGAAVRLGEHVHGGTSGM